MSTKPFLRVRRPLAGLAVLALIAPLAGCSTPSLPDTSSAAGLTMRQVRPEAATALPEVVAATGRIGVTMLAGAPAGTNVVTSPSSLAVALAMLTDGARGTTLAQLEQVLGASGEQRRDAFAALRGALADLDGDPAVARATELPQRPVVHLADQVVLDDSYDAAPDYLAALADGFGAGVQRADLATADGKRVLSAWVDHHTGGLIKESAIRPNDDLKLVLQDAILLAARWQVPFRPSGTAARPFDLGDGSRAEVETMAGTPEVAYAELDGWAAVRLPYAGGRLHADLVLPPAGTDPATVSAELLTGLAGALAVASPEPVELTVPTLDLKPDPLDLLDTLSAIGAPAVRCDSAEVDFGGIGPGEPCVQQAVQQAVLAVDEEGTLAAAVTEIGMEATSAGPEAGEVLHLDRPFLVRIADRTTSWPLFLAAVRDPRH